MLEQGTKINNLEIVGRDESRHRVYYFCRCLLCGQVKSFRSDAISKKNGCGCKTSKLKDETGNRYGKLIVLERRGTRFSNALWLCKCDCGNTTITPGVYLRSGEVNSCGCLRSYGEMIISEVLTNYNISFEREKTFSNCRSNRNWLLRFDFFVNNSYIIEFDGSQHFGTSEWAESSEELLERDKIKNKYCFINNIPIIRIPYWKRNTITIEDLIPETSKYLLKETANV